ncbi:MAG TPA: hypothetical protein VMP68_22980 [Candidatus Eisenbacteria bacterium]|nr:hypothetical protein [Candidatus Eisenbacteria bacterium]
MIQVFIANADVDDLFATATSLNTSQLSTILSNQRINAGRNVPVNVQEDGNGKCLLTIVTARADETSRTKTFANQFCSAGETISVDVFGVSSRQTDPPSAQVSRFASDPETSGNSWRSAFEPLAIESFRANQCRLPPDKSIR